MAKSRNRGGKGGRSAQPSRSVRSSSGGGRRADAGEAEVVEEAVGATWEAGVAFATFLALLVALILLDMHMSESFGAGKLF